MWDLLLKSILAAAAFAFIPGVQGQVASAGCFYDVQANNPTYVYSGGRIVNATPALCYVQCMKQGLTQGTNRTLTIGITKRDICLCGFDLVPAAMMNAGGACTELCVDNSTCGGMHGAISGYAYSALSTTELNIQLQNFRGQDATAAIVSAGEILYLTLTVGAFNCSSYIPCAMAPSVGATTCALLASYVPNMGCLNGIDKPPVDILVDYGDGSGSREWDQDSTDNLWAHMYTRPGAYRVFVMTTHQYDGSVQSASLMVSVFDPISTADQMEIDCPEVVSPGNYFLCSADVPRGTGLTVTVDMVDDITLATDSTSVMALPDYWMDIPGYSTPFSFDPAANLTTANFTGTSFVLRSTNFRTMSNISHLELVPMSAGSLIIEVVIPVCGTGLVWCSITSACETSCASLLGGQSSAGSSYGCSTSNLFCSNEETCSASLTCPTSITSGVAGVAPVSYTAQQQFTVTVTTAQVGQKQIYTIPRVVYTDPTLPNYNFKIRNETAFSGSSYLAVRCPPAPAICVTLPYVVTSSALADLQMTYSAGLYTAGSPISGQLAVRAFLIEDRIVPLEKKFFCNAASDKSVHLTVTDAFLHVVAVSTRKVSCQYPILEMSDWSSNDTANVNQNDWKVITPFPTQTQIETLHANKSYVASLVVRTGETITFDVHMGIGSHANVTWQITSPAGFGDACTTVTKPSSLPTPTNFTDTSGSSCVFPFRYLNVLYYGCTNVTLTGGVFVMCATAVDFNYNAISVSWCNSFCHVQYPRPQELTSNGTVMTFTETEGTSDVYSQQYLVPLATDLQLKRTFTQPGVQYELVLIANNLLNLNDSATMTWNVLCGSPVLAADWTLTHPRFIHTGDPFSLTFTVNKNVSLPTMPVIRIFPIIGDQRTDQTLTVVNTTSIPFYIETGASPEPDCSAVPADIRCITSLTLTTVGVAGNVNSGTAGMIDPTTYGTQLVLTIPSFSARGSHGFGVDMYNVISDIKYNSSSLAVVTENITLLSPLPAGTGNWVTAVATFWDLHWVEVYDPLQGPVLFQFAYSLPQYSGLTFPMNYANGQWFLPAGSNPQFTLSFYSGSVRRIEYTFNNTDSTGYQPAPCVVDWPVSAFGGLYSWNINICGNVSEGLYDVTMSVWNPLDGWLSSQTTPVQILDGVGPIHIDDYLIITDFNQSKKFNISLDAAGGSTCVVVDWGDSSNLEYWGNPTTCQIRFPSLAASLVKPFNLTTKYFTYNHVYMTRGQFMVHAYAFDSQNYAETFLAVTVFKMNCNAPMVWIPINQTSWVVPSLVPKVMRSQTFQVQAMSNLVCNVTTPTYMTWRAYSVQIVGDSISGMSEVLTEIQINLTMPTWNSSLLNVPALSFYPNLIKFVFRLQVETYDPTIQLYREAYTYMNVTKSPLEPILLQGSVTRVTRGWGQAVTITPQLLSIDPDAPSEKIFNFTYWCRVVSPTNESYPVVDSDGFPVFNMSNAQAVPPPGVAYMMNPPPGCFGLGPGPLKTRQGTVNVNTSSFVTFNQVYELLLVLEKDTRRAMAKVEIELLSVPAPIISITCVSTCFPIFGGVLINPTSRFAVRGSCTSDCNGNQTYLWDVNRVPGDPINATFVTTFCDPGYVPTAAFEMSTTVSTTTTTTMTTPAITEELDSLVFTTATETIVMSGDTESGSPVRVVTTVQSATPFSTGKRRRKRLAISPITFSDSCHYVYGDGSRDARDSMDLSIQQRFFGIQPNGIHEFQLQLTVTEPVFDGHKWINASGSSYLTVFLNDPPTNGSCFITIKNVTGGVTVWNPAKTGMALIDQFSITCQGWVDPNGNQITKYTFQSVLPTSGNQTTVLYSGPSQQTTAVFPVGVLDLSVQIFDQYGAYTTYEINPMFPVYLPTQAQYNAYNVNQQLAGAAATGNQALIAQMVAADASIKAKACWFNITCILQSANPDANVTLDPSNMTASQVTQLNNLLLLLTNSNTAAIQAASNNLQFTTVDQLAQGASALAAITANVAGGGSLTANTLDMAGRQAAVDMLSKMAAAFSGMSIPDPASLTTFVTGVTGSVMDILSNLNNILYASDPSQLPLADYESAADMPYDTGIPDYNADIPSNPSDALRANALLQTKNAAVSQVQQMVKLVNDIAISVVNNSVDGETTRTSSPEGMQMIMSKLGGETTVGTDTNGDGYPDQNLRFTFPNSNTVVQFPLGFCPSSPSTGMIKMKNCIGVWGFVIKEWNTITAVYPPSAQKLNPATKQVDVDLYYNDVKVDVSGMAVNIDIIIERQMTKDPAAVTFTAAQSTLVQVKDRLASLKARNKPNMIYHYLNITKADATLNVQVMVDDASNTRLLVLGRYNLLPTLTQCDFVLNLAADQLRDAGFIDRFLGLDQIRNRTGKWFFGVISMADGINLNTTINDGQSCANNSIAATSLSDDFKTETYTLQAYTGGCYYFNESTEIWEAVGIKVYNSTRLLTGCGTNHLCSFGSGFFPQVNTINFNFIFAHASFKDNCTIYMCLIITFIVYFACMIWAVFKDRKDISELLVPVLADNDPENKYFYEMVVETGPLASHSTSANISFVLSGSDDSTGARCFTDPDRTLFKSGALDAFLLATEEPLGELQYIRLWTDSSGLADMGAWYVLSVTVTDVQNGEKFRFVADQWLAVDRGRYEDDIVVHGFPYGSEEDKYFLMKSGGARKLVDEHHWWSVFTRPIRSRFTRCQRVSVCMAVLYLYFLGNALFYKTQPGRVANPIFSVYALPFDTYSVLVGLVVNLIVFPPVLLAVLLFRRSRPLKLRRNRIDLGLEKAVAEGKFNNVDKCHRRDITPEEEKRNRAWSSFGRFFAWFICVLCILGGAILVLAFGLEFGNDKTYQWCVSMIVSFFSSVIITQPIKIIFLALIIGCCCRKPSFDDDHVELDEEPPVIYYYPEDPVFSKPRIKKEKKPKRRMDPQFYADMVKVKNEEMEMRIALRDIAIYLVYLTVICVISYGSRDNNAYLMKASLQQFIIFGGSYCDILDTDDSQYIPCKPTDPQHITPYINFNKIGDVNDWYGWMDRTLLPNVRVQPWYNGAQPYGLRGYLNDRVNRIIGYAIVRQVREELGTCKTAKSIRGAVAECTGNGGLSTEDHRDWCLGWLPTTSRNCTDAAEYEYVTAAELNSSTISAGIRTYGGGGYILSLKGTIDDLNSRITLMKQEQWVDNRTRALIVEFSVYNAQVNLFGTVTCVAEFTGGGVTPFYRINVFRLFPDLNGFGVVVYVAEALFVISIFYYLVNTITVMKKEGCRQFCSDSYNLSDLLTITLSLVALVLYVAKIFVTNDMLTQISNTKGNAYISLTYVSLLNEYYEYVVAFTIFTSTIKFCRLLSFHRAFMQITATIRLCFDGLATFVVEFLIVFGAFSSFFYFSLKNQLGDFRNFINTIENTLAMSIGKFNFSSIRAADEMAAWIFFVFSITVNMILINMMLAIINLSFEEIKRNSDNYKSKFEIVNYVKQQCRYIVGLSVAQPIKPIYVDDLDHDAADGGEPTEMDITEKTSDDFAQKTDELLKYIDNTYLNGFLDEEGVKAMNMMRSKTMVPSDPEEKKMMDYSFNALFMTDPDSAGMQDD